MTGRAARQQLPGVASQPQALRVAARGRLSWHAPVPWTGFSL
jgi:hypothetical protein